MGVTVADVVGVGVVGADAVPPSWVYTSLEGTWIPFPQTDPALGLAVRV